MQWYDGGEHWTRSQESLLCHLMDKWYWENQLTHLDFSFLIFRMRDWDMLFSTVLPVLIISYHYFFTFFPTSCSQVDEVLIYHIDTICAYYLDIHFSNFTLTIQNAWKYYVYALQWKSLLTRGAWGFWSTSVSWNGTAKFVQGEVVSNTEGKNVVCPARIRAYWLYWRYILLCVVQCRTENHEKDSGYTQLLQGAR